MLLKPSTKITPDDLHYFNEGTHYRLYEKLGAHKYKENSSEGFHFAIWAPNAKTVSVIGDFNKWEKSSTPLHPLGSSGLWRGYIPNLKEGENYKYHIVSHFNHYEEDKADPFAFYCETPPYTASKTWDLDYEWKDQTWMQNRKDKNNLKAPISIYEVHLGSWMRKREDQNRSLTYREIAPLLTEYVVKTGYTHIEFMPLMEHPFYGSWGYQVTGYFAPTSRYGTPQDFMHLIDYLHQNDIGVILDWVPSHFPSDAHGLSYFDGTHLYEHSDPRKGFHPDWNSYIFNYGRHEIKSFLISNALFWFDKYHVDGLRVDAVASMLYLDYSRKAGEWIPNEYGGRENLQAIRFLRDLNTAVYQCYPDVQMIAEESTAWPGVSRPVELGGLGFGLKWDMGWMHDTLKYFQNDPVYRKYHHHHLHFRMIYAFHENFILSLSHDEVVHGKGSMLGKMPGDDWQKFANLRLLYAYMFAQPGKKLLFMGCDFGQRDEWNHEKSLDWHLLQYSPHQQLNNFYCELNRIYKSEPALHQNEFHPQTFEWIDHSDFEQSVISFIRQNVTTVKEQEKVIVIFNFTPVPRENYRIGVPCPGIWREILNTNDERFGGSGVGHFDMIQAKKEKWHGHNHSIQITLPPLGALFLKHSGDSA